MIREALTYIIFTIFAFGWMDIGFGPQWTWWYLIAYLGGGV